VGEDGHCARCVRDAERCTTCGRALLDRFWTVVGAPGKFCAECRSGSPTCSVCNAPVRDGRTRDGRFFCRSCAGKAVRDHEGYDGVYRRLVTRARQVLGLDLEKLPELVVESAEALGDRSPELASHAVCGLYARDGLGRSTIHVLSHLPETRVTAVLAHELAHAWQAENCPDEQGLRVREGFAEWVAWRLLDGLDDCEREREVIESRTDEYGLGFRMFTELERRHGTSNAIWYAKAARTEL